MSTPDSPWSERYDYYRRLFGDNIESLRIRERGATNPGDDGPVALTVPTTMDLREAVAIEVREPGYYGLAYFNIAAWEALPLDARPAHWHLLPSGGRIVLVDIDETQAEILARRELDAIERLLGITDDDGEPV